MSAPSQIELSTDQFIKKAIPALESLAKECNKLNHPAAGCATILAMLGLMRFPDKIRLPSLLTLDKRAINVGEAILVVNELAHTMNELEKRR